MWNTAAPLHRFHFVWFRCLRTIRILSPLNIFPRCGCTRRASLCSRLKQSLTCRSVPCCWDSDKSFVALASAPPLTQKLAADTLKTYFSFQPPVHRSPRLPLNSHSSNHQQSTNVPTFTSSTRWRCGDLRSSCIMGNVVWLWTEPPPPLSLHVEWRSTTQVAHWVYISRNTEQELHIFFLWLDGAEEVFCFILQTMK